MGDNLLHYGITLLYVGLFIRRRFFIHSKGNPFHWVLKDFIFTQQFRMSHLDGSTVLHCFWFYWLAWIPYYESGINVMQHSREQLSQYLFTTFARKNCIKQMHNVLQQSYWICEKVIAWYIQCWTMQCPSFSRIFIAFYNPPLPWIKEGNLDQHRILKVIQNRLIHDDFS